MWDLNEVQAFLASMGMSSTTEQILEASLSRIYRHWKDDEFAIITSWRQKKADKPDELEDPAVNMVNLDALKKELLQLGYGHIRLLGHGVEDIPGGVKPVTEPSLLVVNTKGSSEPQEFLNQMITLARKYNQFSFIWHDPDQGSHEVRLKQDSTQVPTPAVLNRFKDFVPAARTYYSQLTQRPGVFSLINRSNESQPWVVTYGEPPLQLNEMRYAHEHGDHGAAFYNALSEQLLWISAGILLSRNRS